jgi:dTDP-3-amino-3,4,6-trideoxy-alpha-D-glucose transaminase
MTSFIPFFDFRSAPDHLRAEWTAAISEVISQGQFIGGSFVDTFENEWAKYLGVANAIGVGNGYDALLIALRALRIGPGDKVIVPAHTFIATWLAVQAVGATPIGIDCDRNGLLNLDLLEKISEIPRAVIPVHMHGQMVDMPRLISWANSKNVSVIEDCAQVHGAHIEGRYAGTWGDIGAFSFYPTKNLGALGDAGALVTNDPELATRIRSIGNYGAVPGKKYSYWIPGLNSRLDPVQASVLSVNLKYLDRWNNRRREIASSYLEVINKVGIQHLHSDSSSVWHHFPLLVNERDETVSVFNSRGIGTEIHYPKSASNNYATILGVDEDDFPVSTFIANHIVSLPMSPWMKDTQILRVMEVLESEECLRAPLPSLGK